MREECCTCSDRLNYVKLCEKYDQLESIHKVLVEDNLTYEKQISDLEAKLAESEERIKTLEFMNKNLNHSLKVAPNANAGQRARIDELKEINHKLKQQLAEKEKKYQDAIANFINLENARAILQLEKVKWVVEDVQYTCGDDNNIRRNFLIKEIDNQIKAIKEKDNG